jgi:hypothetical protein
MVGFNEGDREGDKLKILKEQSLMSVAEGLLCLEWLETRKGDGWVKWTVF